MAKLFVPIFLKIFQVFYKSKNKTHTDRQTRSWRDIMSTFFMRGRTVGWTGDSLFNVAGHPREHFGTNFVGPLPLWNFTPEIFVPVFWTLYQHCATQYSPCSRFVNSPQFSTFTLQNPHTRATDTFHFSPFVSVPISFVQQITASVFLAQNKHKVNTESTHMKPLKTDVKGIFYQALPGFREGFAFWKVLRLRPFVFLLPATCRLTRVRGTDGEILTGENRSK